jgi:hypothetical protein
LPSLIWASEGEESGGMAVPGWSVPLGYGKRTF